MSQPSGHPEDTTEKAALAALEEQQGAGPGFVSRSGVAKIVTNTEEGAYTVTEQRRNTADDGWEDAVSPLGYVDAVARDYLDRAFGTVGQRVRFWEHRRKAGSLDLLIDVVGTAESPLTLNPIDFKSESTQSDPWNRDIQGVNDGLLVRVQMRTVYNHAASPPRLYAFYRTFEFDSLGMLKSVSGETRVTVDEPVDCTI